MKKSKLLVLSLLAVSAMSLTSCGEAGPKGDTGDKGEQGEKGDTGTPGKDGTNGTDGKSFLNGEGVPSDTLGNDGDSYVDTTTFDYYAKENGKWVKKGNIKGEKGDQGDQGEKGDTGAKGDAGAKGDKGDTGSSGSTGSQGKQGDTAWSNTILPNNQDIVITPDKGSYKIDSDVYFYVTYSEVKDDVLNFIITNNGKSEFLKPVSVDGSKYTYKTTMKDGGFVVSASFKSLKDSILSGNENVTLLRNTNISEQITISHDLTLDLNGKTITSVDKGGWEGTVIYVNGTANVEITSSVAGGRIDGVTEGNKHDGKCLIVVGSQDANLKIASSNVTLKTTGVTTDGMYAIYANNGGNLVLGDEKTNTGPTIDSWFAAVGTNNTTATANVTIYGGTYKSSAVPGTNSTLAKYTAVYAACSGTYNIYGGSFTGNKYKFSTPYQNTLQTINIHSKSGITRIADGEFYKGAINGTYESEYIGQDKRTITYIDDATNTSTTW